MLYFYRILILAFKSLGRNVMRSGLTTLGIVIGVAAVIAMVEIGQGASSAVQKTILSMGANNMLIMPGTATSGGYGLPNGQQKIVLTLPTGGTTTYFFEVPPDGQPIILFVEHQTTGGYPKPANVISADFCRLGQLRPRSEVRFELVTLHRARALLQEQEQWLYGLLSGGYRNR